MNNLQVCRAVGHYKQRTVGDEPTQNRQLREVEMGLVDIGDDDRDSTDEPGVWGEGRVTATAIKARLSDVLHDVDNGAMFVSSTRTEDQTNERAGWKHTTLKFRTATLLTGMSKRRFGASPAKSSQQPASASSRCLSEDVAPASASTHQAPEANAADEMTAKQLEALNLLKTRMNQDDSEEEEKEEDLAPKKYIVFHPCERFHMTWDSVVVAAMLYATVEIPFRLGFEYEAKSALDPIELLSFAVDIFMLCDCVVSFRTGFFKDEQYVDDLVEIFKNYVSGWFAVDLLTSLPISFVMLCIPKGFLDQGYSGAVRTPRMLRLLKTLKMLKMIRMMKLMRMMSQWQTKAGAAVNIKFVKFVLLIFVMAHISACAWHYCAMDHSESSFSSWLNEDRAGWVERYEGEGRDVDVWRLYLLALYWAFTTLTTTGYGDITPYRNIELFITILVMFIGTCTFGYIIANISSLIAHEDEAQLILREKIQSIQAFFEHRDLPKELQQKVKQHYEYVWRRSTVFDESEIMEELPRTLRSQVSLHMHREVISNVEFLNSLETAEVALLVENMKPNIAFPGELVVEEDHVGRDMYFCSDGLLELVVGHHSELVSLLVARGSYFAEYALVLEIPKHPASVRAITVSELLSLGKEKFDFVGAFFPQIYEKVMVLSQQRFEEVQSFQRRASPAMLRKNVMRGQQKRKPRQGGLSAASEAKPKLSALKTTMAKTFSRRTVPEEDWMMTVEEKTANRLGLLVVARLQLWKHQAKMCIINKEIEQKSQMYHTHMKQSKALEGDSTKSFTASSRKKGNRPSKFVIGGYSSRLDLQDPDSLRHFELTNTQTDIPESESSKFERDVVNSLHQTSNSSNTMLNKKHNDDCSSSNEEIISVKDSIKKLEERQLRMEKKIDQILDMTRSFGA